MVDALIIQQNGTLMRTLKNVKNLCTVDAMETRTISTISVLAKMLANVKTERRLKHTLNLSTLPPLYHDL